MPESAKAFMELLEANADKLTETDVAYLAGYTVGAESARADKAEQEES